MSKDKKRTDTEINGDVSEFLPGVSNCTPENCECTDSLVDEIIEESRSESEIQKQEHEASLQVDEDDVYGYEGFNYEI